MSIEFSAEIAPFAIFDDTTRVLTTASGVEIQLQLQQASPNANELNRLASFTLGFDARSRFLRHSLFAAGTQLACVGAHLGWLVCFLMQSSSFVLSVKTNRRPSCEPEAFLEPEIPFRDLRFFGVGEILICPL